MDHDKVGALLGQVITDLGATGSAGAMVIGNRLGLYGSLAEGAATAPELAVRTGE